MKARPILMHGRSIRSILAGRKTQTRRIAKPQPEGEVCWMKASNGKFFFDQWDGVSGRNFPCRYGHPGDLFYVRETWQVHGVYTDCVVVRYRANERNSWTEQHQRFPRERATNAKQFWDETRWRPSIHMPRWASRITLHLTDVRVERVQEISPSDCFAEGIRIDDGNGRAEPPRIVEVPYKDEFRQLWNDTNGAGAWDRNDWCWVLCFEVIEANVDDVLADPARYGIGEAA